MTTYVNRDGGHDALGYAMCVLLADGEIVQGDMTTLEVRAYLRAHMREGDTYQEICTCGLPFSDVLSHAELFAAWDKCDKVAELPDPDLV